MKYSTENGFSKHYKLSSSPRISQIHQNLFKGAQGARFRIHRIEVGDRDNPRVLVPLYRAQILKLGLCVKPTSRRDHLLIASLLIIVVCAASVKDCVTIRQKPFSSNIIQNNLIVTHTLEVGVTMLFCVAEICGGLFLVFWRWWLIGND